eukprot:2986954-Amphidinium_carterae.1
MSRKVKLFSDHSRYDEASDYQNNFRAHQGGKHELTFRNFSRAQDGCKCAQDDNFAAALSAPSLQLTSTCQDF